MIKEEQTNYEKERRLFAQAIIEALSIEYKEELASAEGTSSGVSVEHKRHMNELF